MELFIVKANNTEILVKKIVVKEVFLEELGFDTMFTSYKISIEEFMKNIIENIINKLKEIQSNCFALFFLEISNYIQCHNRPGVELSQDCGDIDYSYHFRILKLVADAYKKSENYLVTF